MKELAKKLWDEATQDRKIFMKYTKKSGVVHDFVFYMDGESESNVFAEYDADRDVTIDWTDTDGLSQGANWEAREIDRLAEFLSGFTGTLEILSIKELKEYEFELEDTGGKYYSMDRFITRFA